jgi:hypothetical protein
MIVSRDDGTFSQMLKSRAMRIVPNRTIFYDDFDRRDDHGK